ncbi:universal stress protein [Nocardioides sp. Soil805]|uniref:universal stress protein n=1 Tax=Nocardioides sp. Soil805 TaxID=1736416 RepID=UPI0007028F76|nr:universal stress protein [Nocardioides sp. Soil805]KRF29425.1 universal stress protein UspA [Nocardioides sp. Soil805]
MAVVIGFIPDEYGEAALAYGLGEAQRRHTGVVIVNSTKGDALVDRRYLGEDDKVTLEEQLAASGVEHELRQTTGKDIADEILAVAKEVIADVIVIGIRHRTPVGKVIMGSVAQRVIIDATCPVIAVKPG